MYEDDMYTKRLWLCVKTTYMWSRPIILQNNSKPAEKRKRMAGKIGGRTTADFGYKRPKTGQTKYWMKNMSFYMECWAFKAIVLANFYEINFKNIPFLCLFYPSLLWKRSFEKNAEFFPIWPNFSPKFADNSFLELATVGVMIFTFA
jgi:hypothetical protein